MKMNYQSTYIMVDEDGIVRNIAVGENYEDMNRVTRASYGENAFAVEYRWAVGIGDVFKNNIFYNVNEDGNEIPAEYIPSEEENIAALKAENERLKLESNNLTLALAEMIGGGIYAE